MPRAILLAIAITAFFYTVVALVAVLAVPPSELAYSKTALLLIVARAPIDVVAVFAVIAGISTVNGVLVEILRVSRLTYGMARMGLLPHFLQRVNARTRTPVNTTVLVGASRWRSR